MKKVLFSIILFGISASSAYAGCNKKCIARNPISGNCIQKIKVCSIAPAAWLRDATDELGRGYAQIQSGWHQVYGILPDNFRHMLNNRPFTIIGAAFGGLQGGAFGLAIDRLITDSINSLVQTKEHIERYNLVDWQVNILERGEVTILETRTNIVTAGQEDKQNLLDQIEPLKQTFQTCVNNASDFDSAQRDCLWVFQDSLRDLERLATER